MTGREGNLFGIRMWGTRWRLFLIGLPSIAVTALISLYILWRTKNTRKKKTPAEETNKQIASEVNCQSSLLDSSISSQTATAPLPGVPTAAVLSPSDSGYVEQSPSGKELDPYKPQVSDSNTPPLPLPPPNSSHLSTVRPFLDTMAIRGGRVRATVYLPIDIVGRFIGRQGRNIKSLMSESGAQIHVQQKNLAKDASLIPCVIQGTQQQISSALDLVLLRHPEVSLAPQFTSTYFKSNDKQSETDDTSWEHDLKCMPNPSATFLAIVTYIEKLNRVWLVPYNSTQLLEDLHHSMSQSYSCSKPDDTRQDEVDIVKKYCSVRVSDEYWLRGHVIKEVEEGLSYEVKLMDYGSSVIVTLTSIRPLRKEHTLLPVQAFPCQLANVHPINSESEDGMLVLQALVESTVLEVHPTGSTTVSDNNVHIPLIELYIPSHYGSEGQAFINRELVNQGFAIWKEIGPVNVTSKSSGLPHTQSHPAMEEVPIVEPITTQVDNVTSTLPLIELLSLKPMKDNGQLKTKDDDETSHDPFSDVGTPLSSAPPVSVGE